MLVLFATTAVLNYIQTYWLSATGERTVAGLRRELFGKLLTFPPGFYADRRTGELTSRLTADIGLLQGILSHQLAEGSRQVMALVGGITILAWMQPKLVLAAVGVMPLVVGSAMLFGRRLKRITTGVQDQLAESTAVAEEVFGQIRVVQGFAQEPHEVARYGERVRALPAGHDPRVALGLVSAGLVISAGALMARAISRWRRAADVGTESGAAADDAASRDDYDARIDEELRELR